MSNPKPCWRLAGVSRHVKDDGAATYEATLARGNEHATAPLKATTLTAAASEAEANEALFVRVLERCWRT